MTAASLESIAATLHARAVADVVRREAPALGADPDVLLDSVALERVTSRLDPAHPSFGGAVAAAARAVVSEDPQRFAARQAAPPASPPPPPAQPAPPAEVAGDGGQRQWTDADVAASGPRELLAAIEAGQLRDLGWPPRRPRR